MEPIETKYELPPESVMNNGDENVWWWDSYDDCWRLGTAMLMDFEGDPNLFDRYTHWLPEEQLPIPN